MVKSLPTIFAVLANHTKRKSRECTFKFISIDEETAVVGLYIGVKVSRLWGVRVIVVSRPDRDHEAARAAYVVIYTSIANHEDQNDGADMERV